MVPYVTLANYGMALMGKLRYNYGVTDRIYNTITTLIKASRGALFQNEVSNAVIHCLNKPVI